MFFVAFGYTQSTLMGTIKNSKSKPVSKALVYLDSINSGVKTDKKGFYSVELPTGTKVINVYSYKYGLLSSTVENQKVINFVYLDAKKKTRNGIKRGAKVALTYSEENQEYVARSVPNLKPDSDKNLSNYITIFDYIRGRVAGVTVSQGNQIRIRGVNSLVGSGEPLFVVDGSPVNSIDNILPVNVQKIRVLKGPAASIYGSRGSNGVIVISTKN